MLTMFYWLCILHNVYDVESNIIKSRLHTVDQMKQKFGMKFKFLKMDRKWCPQKMQWKNNNNWTHTAPKITATQSMPPPQKRQLIRYAKRKIWCLTRGHTSTSHIFITEVPTVVVPVTGPVVWDTPAAGALILPISTGVDTARLITIVSTVIIYTHKHSTVTQN